jgi:prolyl-tRNA editing enzyme YbaK/EbsC (Cys-tRNA(Pro) deacylase)
MIDEEEKLKEFIKKNNIEAEHLRFDESIHSVQEYMRVTKIPLELITKTMIFKSEKGVIAALVPAKFRVSTTRVAKIIKTKPLIASAFEAYELTGYPVGGMPFFGYESTLIVDPKVLEKEFIYTGGGSEYSTIKISTKEIIKLKPIIQRIRGKKSN